MSKNNKNTQSIEWTEEGFEKFLKDHPDYPEPAPVDCLNLIMKKENALAIISGEKKLEFRAYTQHYVNRLYDAKTEEFVERHKDEPDVLFWCDTLRPVERIHFYNYNDTWSLDVECTYNNLVAPTDDGVNFLHEEYDCHELDEMHRKLKREGAEDYPLFFYFEIGKILEKNNI